MNIFHGRSIKTKLLAFTGIFVLGLAVFGFVALSTLGKVKINGPIYGDLTNGMTLLADVLPPPAYVVESLLVVHEIKDVKDPKDAQVFCDRLEKLKTEYNDRHVFWDNTLPQGEIRHTFLNKAHEPAVEFYRLIENELIPAVKAGKTTWHTKLPTTSCKKHSTATKQQYSM